MTIKEERDLIKEALSKISLNETITENERIMLDNIETKNQIKLDNFQIRAYMGKLAAARLLHDLPDSPNRNKYERQLECCNTILWKGEAKSNRYCSERMCPICASITMSKFINGYKESLERHGKLYFLTLTAKTVKRENLKERINEMQKYFSRITKNNTEANRKKPERQLYLNGLRKLEVIVAKDKRFHCHYHILIDSLEGAEYIKENWLLKWQTKNKRLASNKAQDIRPVTSVEDSLVELTKYVSKPSYRQKETNRLGEEIPISSQEKDDILTALFKVQTFKPFGTVRKNPDKYKETSAKYVIFKPRRLTENEYVWRQKNWYAKNGQALGQARIRTNETDMEKLKTKVQKNAERMQKLSEKINVKTKNK